MPNVQAMADAPPALAAIRSGWGAAGVPTRCLQPGGGLQHPPDASSRPGATREGMFAAPIGCAGSSGPIGKRLHTLCTGIVARYTDRAQTIRLDIAVDGDCPAMLDAPVLHIVRQGVGNAVRYGMHLRLIGRVCVRLLSCDGTTSLTIADDGWECHDHPRVRGSWQRIDRMARRYGGCTRLYRGHMTTINVELPHRA